MRFNSSLGLFPLAALSLVTLGAGRPEPDDKHAAVRVITRWDDDCDASNRLPWDDMLDSWYFELTAPFNPPDGHGDRAWIDGGFKVNGTIIDSDFTDPGKVTWGHDDARGNLDRKDAFMLGMHGGETGDPVLWKGRVRVDEAGDGNCRTWQGSMLLGNWDLEFLHLSSCHSMCHDNPFSWEDNMVGVHQITGFHGIMYIIPWWPILYEDFADDGFDESIAEAWLDNLYDFEHWYEVSQSGDQCPVTSTSGADLIDAWDRMDRERYDFVFDDPTPNSLVRMWVGGCDPDDDPAMP